MNDPALDPKAGNLSDEQDDMAARALAGIDQARKTATRAIRATRRKSEEVIDDTREKTYRAAAETNRLFYEHPVAAVAAAAAAGAILGIFLPRVTIASKAGKLAGQAMKAAVASEAAQMMWSSIRDTRDAAVKSAAGKAASAVGGRIAARRAQIDAQADVNDADIAEPGA